jgi:sulfite exporter TauE/SafE
VSTDPDEPEASGYLEPTPPGVVTAWGVAGLVLGWLAHPVSESVRGTALLVSWVQPAALLLLAVTVATTAWQTWRTVQVRHERLEPHRAVNRLVLGRASALVGALVAGGYAGYAVSWIGSEAELAGQRMLRSALAACCALLLVAAGLLLERACRVRKGPPEP